VAEGSARVELRETRAFIAADFMEHFEGVFAEPMSAASRRRLYR
jgi:hypothetical protein